VAAAETAVPVDADRDRAAAVVERIRRVPDRLRRFAVPARVARTYHRIDAELLDRLVRLGLPHAGDGPGRRFDDYDLGNAALELGLPSVRRRAMRAWGSALDRGGGRRAVHYVPGCPAPGHPGLCPFDLLVPGGERIRRTGPGDGVTAVHSIALTLPGEWPALPPPLRDLLASVPSLRFFLLPEALRWDLGFVRATGLGDCGSVAKLLVTEGRRRRLPVRFAFGLLVAKPYSTPHCWAELAVDGRWVPVDPLLVDTLRRLGALPEEWTPDRSVGGLVARLGGRFTRVVEHGGIWAPLSLPTDAGPEVAR
jgi:hypothetical protein